MFPGGNTLDRPLVLLKNFSPKPTPELALIYAARLCKNSFNRSDTPEIATGRAEGFPDFFVPVGPTDTKLAKSCLNEGHESITEHVSLTFEFNLSRVAHTQLIRHRLASFSAESARAVDQYKKSKEELETQFFIPHTVQHSTTMGDDGVTHKAIDQFWGHMELSMKLYRHFILCGIPVEDARYVLPIALMQPMLVTANLREWRHILRERCCKTAQFEIRYMMKKVRRIMAAISPLFVHGATKMKWCEHKDACGECETDWELMENEQSLASDIMSV